MGQDKAGQNFAANKCAWLMQETDDNILQAKESNVVEEQGVRKAPASKAAKPRPRTRKALQENLQSPEF